MVKIINFDMDGTLVDFYGVENWLEYLTNSNPYPYIVAKPLVNMSALARVLHRLQKNGYKVRIVSWLAKNSNENFDAAVTEAKIKWLKSHIPSVIFDEIIIVPYGTYKENLSDGILFDDEENNRKFWGNNAYNVDNILEVLKGL